MSKKRCIGEGKMSFFSPRDIDKAVKHLSTFGKWAEPPIERNWKFTVSNPIMVNVFEITKDLSRENPVAFIRVNSGPDENTLSVVFHTSIIKKAKFIGELPFNVDQIAPELFFVFHCKKTESEIIAWAKGIKNNTWGKHLKPSKVTVGIPKI